MASMINLDLIGEERTRVKTADLIVLWF